MKLPGEATYVRLLQMSSRWLIPLAALVAACRSGEMTGATTDPCTSAELGPPINGLVVTPASALLRAGDTLRLFASVPQCYAGNRPQAIRWAATDTTVVSVDASGLVRAKGSGTTTVVATAVPDSTTKAAGVVTVSP